MNELNHLFVELSGRNLIEASAGTGKTYAIACLYLRLLIEKELTPDQILVVTYTEAATEELRGRIRSRIREALEVCAGSETQDPFLAGLAANVNGRGPDRLTAMKYLDRALKSFDTAAIFTIHGFCLRVLQDNAFETGSLYDTGLVTDQTGLMQEIADDFWRIRFFGSSAPLLGYALRKKYSPAYFSGFLTLMLSTPKLKVIPEFSTDDIADIEHGCRKLFDRLRDLWSASATEISNIMHTDKGLSRSAENYRLDLIPALLNNMSEFLEGGNPFDLFDGFDKFCAGSIEKQRMKKNPPPSHACFDLCEELLNKVEERFLALRSELVAFGRERAPYVKQEANIRFFDDLLNDLYTALHDTGGDLLAGILRRRYRAALIDEFQDTDPVQYDIFRKMYADPDSPLFLIGDPKQAIYSFRGADIFAYLEAASDVEESRRFTLTDNWRSTPELLTAFNTLFTDCEKPFVFDEIAYHPVTSGRGGGGAALTVTGGDSAPLQLWCMPPAENGGALNVGSANAVVPLSVASEIARLLQEGANVTARIGDRPLLPGDIAVIVRSHRQAGSIQDALANLGIPSVMRSDRTVFATEEARDLCTLFAALADCGDESKIRAALVTSILGRSGSDIAQLLEDEDAWERCLTGFRSYHQLWLEKGFMVMSQTLLAREGVRGRLLRRPDGERRLTNLIHCFEVIHRADHEKGLGVQGLLTWFSERVSTGEKGEEFQIRLETDEDMVRIVTVHVSKGLEYPIVFCPFMWGGIHRDDEVVTFHDRFTMVRDFGSPEYALHKAGARTETLAESLRLLYVALTRARFRCYLIAGKVVDTTRKNRPETSPLAYLFHASKQSGSGDDHLAVCADEVGSMQAQQMEDQLATLAAKSDGSISVTPMRDPADAIPYVVRHDDGEPLACRSFSGTVEQQWRVASFTSFTAHDATSVELPDRDEPLAGESVPASGSDGPSQVKSIFTFPRGAQAGIFFHTLFEGLDFTSASPASIAALVEKGLDTYGYSREWQPFVSSMVADVISVPFDGPDGSFTLSDLKPGAWLRELEFFFPLKFITSDVLGDVARAWNGRYEGADLLRSCASLKFKPVRGMVRGFMDMVFEHNGRYYLLDWKSNHLGHRLEDYGRTELNNAMESNAYTLQYLLYTVALNRYLGLRVKEYDYPTHFGGVIYLFLRGISPEKGEQFGVFRDTPPVELIHDLTACLIESGGWRHDAV